MRVAIIGGLAAGPAAAAEAARRAPDAEVVMFEAGPHISVGTCELPYGLGGALEVGLEELIAVSPEEMTRTRGVTVHLRHRVTALEARTGILTIDALEFGATRQEQYDRVIVATGARPRRLEVDGEGAAGVFTLRNLIDATGIDRWVDTQPVRHVVVAGGGYVGLEVAEAMRRRGLRVTILEPRGRVLNSTVACEVSEQLDDAVLEAGVTVRPERVTEVLATDDGRVEAVRTDKGEIVGCQMVIASVGVEPRTELARAAGLRVGSMGGLEVDNHMQTSSSKVWACGDVVEIPRAPDKKRVLWPLATTARRTARVAARNAVSRRPVDTFRPFAGSVAVLAFGIEVGSVGLSLSLAKEAGLDAVASDIRHQSRTSAFAASRPIDVRLVVERGSGRILGGQLVGQEGAALRANVLAPLVQSGATARELAEDVDLLYTPPLSPAVDPLKVAASQAMHLIG